MKKKYKALMLDLDGTTIPNHPDGMPSQKVIDAINKAQKKLHVSVVTGRPYYHANHLFEALQLQGPSIVGGGTAIMDAKTHALLWDKPVPPKDVEAILKLLSQYKKDILILESANSEEYIYHPHRLPKRTILISFADLEIPVADAIIEDLKRFPSIAAHKIVGWKPNTVWMNISHTEATKQHAIFEVAKILDIETHEIIGVGDGYNDFPLLMACGLKVAMGNALPDLKAIADYVAPTVDEDGVVDVIAKFVL